MNKLPRSFRNNNPFNIKKSSSRWIGKVKGSDKVFETFDSLEHGIRAGLKLLTNYVQKGSNTPRKIIERFAPSSENNSKAYLDFVCDGLVLPFDKPITNWFIFLVFCERIIMFESGLNHKQLNSLGINFHFLSDVFYKYNLKLSFYEKD